MRFYLQITVRAFIPHSTHDMKICKVAQGFPLYRVTTGANTVGVVIYAGQKFMLIC